MLGKASICLGHTGHKRRHSRPDDTPPRDERQAKRRRNKMSKTMTNSSSCYSLLACVMAVWRGRRAHPRVIPADTGRDSRQPLRGPSIRSAANSSDCERRKPIRGEVRCRQGGGGGGGVTGHMASFEPFFQSKLRSSNQKESPSIPRPLNSNTAPPPPTHPPTHPHGGRKLEGVEGAQGV